MSVNDEIAAIEAVVDDLEKKIADGRLSVESVVNYHRKIIQGMSVAEVIANADKIQAKFMEFVGHNKIDAQRIREFREHHPSDPRINQLAHRAADCYFTLCEIVFASTEADQKPDEKAQMHSEHQSMLKDYKKVLPQLFGL